jgi:hypothetical protein
MALALLCRSMLTCSDHAAGPVNQFHENSAFYSGKAPERRVKRRLPHMTVVMPVVRRGPSRPLRYRLPGR